MRRSLAWLLPLGLLLLPLLAGAQSFPRDDTGTPAPPVYYEDPAGTFNRVRPGTAMPVTDAGVQAAVEAQGDVTVTTTDQAFGKRWTQPDGIPSTGMTNANNAFVPLLLANNQLVVFQKATDNALDVYTTTNGGLSWTRIRDGALSLAAGEGLRNALYLPATGQALLLNQDGVIYQSSDLSSWTTRADLSASWFDTGAIRLQGTTCLMLGFATGTTLGVARSTDSCTTFGAVTTPASFATPTVQAQQRMMQALATPAASIWLVAITDAAGTLTIQRSTDDGVTWSQVFSATPAGAVQAPAIACLTATICLASDYRSIFRSTNAGATWASVLSTGASANVAQCCGGFVAFGGGVVAAMGDPATAPSTAIVSSDNGVTWTGAQTTGLTGTDVRGGPWTGSAVGRDGLAVIGTPFGTRDSATGVVQVTPVTRPLLSTEVLGSQGLAYRQAPDGSLAIAGQRDDTAPATVAEEAYGQLRITTNRAAHVNLRNDGGTEIGTATTPVRVDPTGTTTQPVSGTVTATANQGTAAAGTSAWPVSPIQGATLFNSVTTGAANTAVTVTIAAAAGTRAHLYGLDARCSAGTATLDVDDGATGIWDSAAGEVGTTTVRFNWTTALTGSTNTAMTITLSACGAGNTGTLIVQADRF